MIAFIGLTHNGYFETFKIKNNNNNNKKNFLKKNLEGILLPPAFYSMLCIQISGGKKEHNIGGRNYQNYSIYSIYYIFLSKKENSKRQFYTHKTHIYVRGCSPPILKTSNYQYYANNAYPLTLHQKEYFHRR